MPRSAPVMPASASAGVAGLASVAGVERRDQHVALPVADGPRLELGEQLGHRRPGRAGGRHAPRAAAPGLDGREELVDHGSSRSISAQRAWNGRVSTSGSESCERFHEAAAGSTRESTRPSDAARADAR